LSPLASQTKAVRRAGWPEHTVERPAAIARRAHQRKWRLSWTDSQMAGGENSQGRCVQAGRPMANGQSGETVLGRTTEQQLEMVVRRVRHVAMAGSQRLSWTDNPMAGGENSHCMSRPVGRWRIARAARPLLGQTNKFAQRESLGGHLGFDKLIPSTKRLWAEFNKLQWQ